MATVDAGLLVLRVVVGLLLAAHGAQKLFGWFGGSGMTGFTGFTRSLRLRPAPFWAWVGALSEFSGGLLLALGLATPLAAAAIISDMLVAIATLHWQNGIWTANGGYEYNLVLITVAAALGIAGAGAYSLDAVSGLYWPVAVFAAAVVLGSAGAVVGLATRGQPAPAAQPEAGERAA